MLNEVRARHIKGLIVKRIDAGVAAIDVVGFEIARREDTVRGLDEQSRREQEEIAFLRSLDVKELAEEKEKENV